MSLSVELDEQTAALVQELAANDQRSASEVIHDALAVYACLGKAPCLPEWGNTEVVEAIRRLTLAKSSVKR